MTPDRQPPRHVVVDDFLPADLAGAAAAAWPPPGWEHWLEYDSPLERKRTMNRCRFMPRPLVTALARVLFLPVGDALGAPEALVPDLGLYGAGMHDMGPGDWLDLHRDASHHADCGVARRANAVLYLTPGWRGEWGGALELWPDAGGGPGGDPARVLPLFNRLVVFDAAAGYHGVPHPLACPAGVRRASLSVFWYGSARGPVARPRAAFVAYPGRPATPGEEELRRRRMG
jgi:Rps23 Pro-64 3,4-dihydroxylase Tpa1-like proline 4-hydroxylase